MSNQTSSDRNALISGASGMIGKAISQTLESQGYRVYALDRQRRDVPFFYDQAQETVNLDASISLDVVINLAGANIADGRWTQQRKQVIWESRVTTTRLLCEALATLPHRPQVLLSGSAIGYYGKDRSEAADEESAPGHDFLAELSVAWEEATGPAVNAGIRTVILRFGLVMSSQGGVIDKLVMPLRLAVAGRLGDGNHLQSWISLQDVVQTMEQCIANQNFSGPINVVAPEVLRQKEFVRTLSRVLKRPLLPPVPAGIARLMFGEMADEALLASANINSKRMQELGVDLRHPTLQEALQAEFS